MKGKQVRPEDMIGKRFGRLLVLEESEPRITPKSKQRRWLCRCDCGQITTVFMGCLRSGQTTSCGCFGREVSSTIGRTHGHASNVEGESPEYLSWVHMIQRCRNPHNDAWPRYGGRGITVCERWKSFEAFLEDMGPRPSLGHSIERRDNDLGYSPENCYWATTREQARNTKRSRLITSGSKTLCLQDWATQLGISPDTLQSRLAHGWTLERAFTEPVHQERRKKGKRQ